MKRPEIETAAQRMATVVAGVEDGVLARPTPCAAYDVAALLDHIDGFVGAFTDAARKANLDREGAPPPGVSAHLATDWRDRIPTGLATLTDAWRADAAFDGMTRAGGIEMPGEIAAAVVVEELVVHGWDLARATGQVYDCSDAEISVTEALVEQISGPDQADQRGDAYGAPVAVASGVTTLDRVLALTGRDPQWSPAH